MIRQISALLLRLAGWKVNITIPDYPKAIICVAPHTSNFDFIIGKLAYSSVGRKAGFLMKKSWFFFPLGCIFRAMGGIPVDRSKGSPSLTDALIRRFDRSERLVIAITPEGTRKATVRWHTGFLHIAYSAKVPVALGAIDYSRKLVTIERTLLPSGNIDEDMLRIKDYYKIFKGKYPEKFIV